MYAIQIITLMYNICKLWEKKLKYKYTGTGMLISGLSSMIPTSLTKITALLFY